MPLTRRFLFGACGIIILLAQYCGISFQNEKTEKAGALMTKQEISEIKKLLTPKKCSITRICGCYVDGEKNKKTEIKQSFLALPEDEMFKYFEIFRKTLSGGIGKNLLALEFPLQSEEPGVSSAP